MKISTLFQDKDLCSLCSRDQDIDISGIVSDSRLAVDGVLFVSLQGEKQDGNAFIHDAIARGARAVLVKTGTNLAQLDSDIVCIEHDDPRSILPVLLNQFYDHPCAKIPVIGVTGTNGKTTVTYLIESIYALSGKQCGIIGTVNYRFAGEVFPAKNTTPGLTENFNYLSRMIAAGVDACVMEVSSHALVQGRVDGFIFSEAVFTNLTRDHLDYHQDQEDYFLAKARLFDGSYHIEDAIINIDDLFGERLTQMGTGPVMTYGFHGIADVKAEDVCISLEGSEFTLVTIGKQIRIKTSLIGKHNIYNILAAASVSLKRGFSLEQIKQGIEALGGVPGRLERIREVKDVSVLVDYAHTEDALKNVLESIRETEPSRIITVFGCGGDRDKTKRSRMAAVVDALADFAIVTNDNPRSEDPQAIADDILYGFQSDDYEVILDRAEAIAKSLKIAKPGDCVLIAGKGHEDYQIFKDETIHFDDREIVRNCLKG